MFNFNFIRKIKKFFFPFYKNSDLKFVFKKLQQNTKSQTQNAMFVGGCVRKYLSNESIDDIDIATSLTTDEIKFQHILLAGALGFEPRMAVSKTAALPLGYAPLLNL